jgi:hypothetical protein
VPVTAIPVFSANILPFKSSMISKQFLNSFASAIALASPLSTNFSIKSCKVLSLVCRISIQKGSGFLNSEATSGVMVIV